MHSLKNINSLSKGSSLNFGERGLTIIYGTNGSGKSGYSRVLKKCCQARKVDEAILPNVFEKEGGRERVAEAIIDYSLDDDRGNIADEELAWKESNTPSTALKQIWIYDRDCGKIQITENNKFAYAPGDVNVFEKLVAFVLKVKNKVEKRRPQKLTIDTTGIDESTETYRRITSLNSQTNKQEIEEEFGWGDMEKKNLALTCEAISKANPASVKMRLAEIDRNINKARELKNFLVAIERLVSQEKSAEYRSLVESKNDLEEALNKIALDMSNDRYIQGTGNELWFVMYDAAKKFATVNTATNDYLHVDGRCVLCQQILDNEAKKRMQEFSIFVRNEFKKQLDICNNTISSSIKKLENARTDISRENIIEFRFSIMDSEQQDKICSYVDLLKNSHSNTISFLKGEDSEEEIVCEDQSVSSLIDGIITEANDEKKK